ncbi:MAG: hypothetical protein JWP27_671, partial [Flaviaesturariibacter sp.]|nr:hypothetical protein [Flaviaesturariibacter sp.]
KAFVKIYEVLLRIELEIINMDCRYFLIFFIT